MNCINKPKQFTAIIALLANSLVYCAAPRPNSEVRSAEELAKPKSTALETALAEVHKCTGFKGIESIEAGFRSYDPRQVNKCQALSGFTSFLSAADKCVARELAMHKGYSVKKTWSEILSGTGCFKYGPQNSQRCFQNDDYRSKCAETYCQDRFAKNE